MDKHNLSGWTLDMNYNMKTTFGRCNVITRTISLSAILVTLNDEPQVLDTIRHEIAHAIREKERGFPLALTQGAWHDSRWKQIATSIGCSAKQFYNTPDSRPVITGKVHIPFPWKKTCPKCGSSAPARTRKKNTGCGTCNTPGTPANQFIFWVYTQNK